jgi:hypothetical protein
LLYFCAAALIGGLAIRLLPGDGLDDLEIREPGAWASYAPGCCWPGWLAGCCLVSTGHAGAERQRVGVLSDFIHLAATGVWIGGLLLPALLWRIRRSQERRLPCNSGRSGSSAFSCLASLAVFVLALSGVFNSLVEISAWRICDDTYGRCCGQARSGGAALGILFNNRLVQVEGPPRITICCRAEPQVAGGVSGVGADVGGPSWCKRRCA